MIDVFAIAVALVTFGVASWSDIKTRRIKNILWVPAFVIGLALLVARLVSVQGEPSHAQVMLAIQIGISFGFIIPLALAFWSYGLFGGADARALIVLAVLAPRFPEDPITVANYAFPLYESAVGVFSMSALTNGLLLTAAYPLWLYVRNIRHRTFLTPWAFVAVRLSITQIMTAHGKLVQTPDGMTFNGLDLDALRMYLRWRGLTLDDIRSDPEHYRTTLPDETHPVGDGRVMADGGVPDDAWGAEYFLSEYSAYGTTPETLREGLDLLANRDIVWVTPGLPLIVSFFLGLVTAILIGDVLSLALEAIL